MHKWTCEAVYVKQVDTSCISMRRYAYYKIKRIHTYPKLLASLLSPFLGLQSTNEIDHYCAQYDRVLCRHLKYLCHTTPPVMHAASIFRRLRTNQHTVEHRSEALQGAFNTDVLWFPYVSFHKSISSRLLDRLDLKSSCSSASLGISASAVSTGVQ